MNQEHANSVEPKEVGMLGRLVSFFEGPSEAALQTKRQVEIQAALDLVEELGEGVFRFRFGYSNDQMPSPALFGDTLVAFLRKNQGLQVCAVTPENSCGGGSMPVLITSFLVVTRNEPEANTEKH